MKITNNTIGKVQSLDIKSAIEYVVTPDAYSYDNEISKLKLENQLLGELVARLIETMYDDEMKENRDNERLEYILGYGFEVTE